nr:hypothetical protein [Tanacetum cinerariifolium]
MAIVSLGSNSLSSTPSVALIIPAPMSTTSAANGLAVEIGVVRFTIIQASRKMLPTHTRPKGTKASNLKMMKRVPEYDHMPANECAPTGHRGRPTAPVPCPLLRKAESQLLIPRAGRALRPGPKMTYCGAGGVKYVMQTDLFLPVLNAPEPAISLASADAAAPRTHGAKLWLPKRVLFTPDALDEEYGQQLLARATALDLDIELLKSNRLTGLRGEDERATYRTAKTTLAV